MHGARIDCCGAQATLKVRMTFFQITLPQSRRGVVQAGMGKISAADKCRPVQARCCAVLCRVRAALHPTAKKGGLFSVFGASFRIVVFVLEPSLNNKKNYK